MHALEIARLTRNCAVEFTIEYFSDRQFCYNNIMEKKKEKQYQH